MQLTVQNLLLPFRALDLRDMTRCIEQAELPPAVETLVHAQPARVDAERGCLLRNHQVKGLFRF